MASLPAELRRFRSFVSRRTIYKLAFPGETPSPVGEPCESPSLRRAAGALPGCQPPGCSGLGAAREVPEPQPWVQLALPRRCVLLEVGLLWPKRVLLGAPGSF